MTKNFFGSCWHWFSKIVMSALVSLILSFVLYAVMPRAADQAVSYRQIIHFEVPKVNGLLSGLKSSRLSLVHLVCEPSDLTFSLGAVSQGSGTLMDGYTQIADSGLSQEMVRVRDWVSQTYRVSKDSMEPVLVQVQSSARKEGLDPFLIVAMMAIESSFNPMAQSHAGAQGLMQVIPRFHQDKIGENAPSDALFDPLINVQVGTQVLAEGLERFGSLNDALQYYGGARNDPHQRYAKKVLNMQQRIVMVAQTDRDA